ncbi:MAG TPA: hypothetical protein VFR85_05010 [Anaeromyxobacteraceae bacterium]|nr:hypothetical protein [Anaeromyxobacteraceae bacterium]
MKHLAVAVALLLGGCGRGTREEAEQAVRTYLDRLVLAYRTSDASLVDPLVGEPQALKLVGLIGVKRDAGVVLDARLLDIQFLRAERQGDRWIVETRERWYYRDRRIGTGEQVGEDSTDSYAMRYVFSRNGGRYLLEDLSFVGEPVVGRKVAPLPTEARVLHGLPPAGAGAGNSPGQPPPAPARPPEAPKP